MERRIRYVCVCDRESEGERESERNREERFGMCVIVC